jgi:hypothetical protein
VGRYIGEIRSASISGDHSSPLVWGYAMIERSVVTLVARDLLPAALTGTFDRASALFTNDTRPKRMNEPGGGILAEEKHS